MSIYLTVLDSNKANLFDGVDSIDTEVYSEFLEETWVPSRQEFKAYCLGLFQNENYIWFQGVFRDATYLRVTYFKDRYETFEKREAFLDILRNCSWKEYFSEDVFYQSNNEYIHIFDLNKISWSNIILAVSLARMGWENHTAGKWALSIAEMFPDISADHILFLACSTGIVKPFYGNVASVAFDYVDAKNPGHMTFKFNKYGYISDRVIQALIEKLDSLPPFKSTIDYDSERVFDGLRGPMHYAWLEYANVYPPLLRCEWANSTYRDLSDTTTVIKDQLQLIYDFLRGV